MTTTGITGMQELVGPSQVLVFARERRADADQAEADVLVAAVIWAEQHPPESVDEAASWIGGAQTGLPLAGEGVPAPRRSTTTRSPSTAPPASRASSTWPTPWTWTPPSPGPRNSSR